MIKSAGDTEEMSGFENPFSGYICDGCAQHCLQERYSVRAKKYQKKKTTMAHSFALEYKMSKQTMSDFLHHFELLYLDNLSNKIVYF